MIKKNDAQNIVERKKEAINDFYGGDVSYNEFYHSVSVVFRIISFILFAAFLLFAISSAFASAEGFSYENLEYIVRNFALKLDENRDASRYSIKYNPDADRSYALFGDGLAVCGASQLSIYSATGRLTCSEPIGYSKPVMVTSEKFVLVYDNGGNNYTVYNSFTDVYTGEVQYPIRGAAISDNGSYALITSSDSYNSVVEVYNSDFQKVNSVNRTGYITSVDISETHVIVGSLAVDETNTYQTSLICCLIGSDKAEFDVEGMPSFLIKCRLNSEGYTVVYEDRIEFCNSDTSSRGIYNFEDRVLSDFRIDDSGALLLFKSIGFETDYTAVGLSSDSKLIHETPIESTVFDIEYNDEISYVLTDDSIVCIDNDKLYHEALAEGNTDIKLLSYDKYCLYICTNTAALTLDISADINGD